MKTFEELKRIEKLKTSLPPDADIFSLGNISFQRNRKFIEFPVYGFRMGSRDPAAPTLGLFGGVHGLERVGSHVILAFLESLIEQMKWDEDLQKFFQTVRIVSIPVINPGGMFIHRRANPNGVDLMRNAPIDPHLSGTFMVGGHRISSFLPWYRGALEGPMEKESQILCDFVRAEMFESKCAIAVDFHSGFGSRDRLWYPYARQKGGFPLEPEAKEIQALLNRSYPHHIYKIEGQSDSYRTVGDLWDYLFDEHHEKNKNSQKVFFPWTLEMGSWLWLRKNPLQLFSMLGPFNPVKPHRQNRIMRRHLHLISFFMRIIKFSKGWRSVK